MKLLVFGIFPLLLFSCKSLASQSDTSHCLVVANEVPIKKIYFNSFDKIFAQLNYNIYTGEILDSIYFSYDSHGNIDTIEMWDKNPDGGYYMLKDHFSRMKAEYSYSLYGQSYCLGLNSSKNNILIEEVIRGICEVFEATLPHQDDRSYPVFTVDSIQADVINIAYSNIGAIFRTQHDVFQLFFGGASFAYS